MSTSTYFPDLGDDDDDLTQMQQMARIISPRSVQSLLATPPDAAPISVAGQSTVLTGSLAAPPRESIAKNLDTAAGRTAYNVQPAQPGGGVAPASRPTSVQPAGVQQVRPAVQPVQGNPDPNGSLRPGGSSSVPRAVIRDLNGRPAGSPLSALPASLAANAGTVSPAMPQGRLAAQQVSRVQAYNASGAPAQYADSQTPVATDPNNPDPSASLRPAGNPVMPAMAPRQVQPVNPPTPLDRSQARLAYLTGTGSGVSQIKNPVGRVAAGIADVAGTILAPGIAAAIPGTTLHHNVLLNQAQAQLSSDQDQEQRALQEENTRGEIAERNARISAMQNPTPEAAKTITTDQGVQQWNPATQRYDILAGQSPDRLNKYQLITAGDGTMFRVDPADPTHAEPITGPDGKQLTGKQESKYVQLEGADGKPHTVEVDSRGNTIKDLGPTGEKPPQVSVNTGTWTLDEDKDGKPVLFNSKTGESKDAPNLQKAGTAAKAAAAQEKLTEPVNSAMGYANDYLKNGVFTGSGDEALQEKFFELAKPSTGFRMSQPQIDMLQNARSWMGGAEARARHALTGTWFSNQQRQQIVQTMNDLGQSKARVLATGGQAPATGNQSNGWPSNIFVPKGQIGVQLKDGTYGHIAPSARAKFLKDNPGARTF